MKLGIDTEYLRKQVRGVGRYTQTLVEELEKKKEIDLLCYQTKNVSQAPHRSYHLFRKNFPLPFASSLAALTHFYCFKKVDLFHFTHPKILFGRKPSIPYLLTIHDLMPLTHPHFFPKKSTWMMYYFLPHYLKHAKKIIAVSEHTKKELLTFLPLKEEHIAVIPWMLSSSIQPSKVQKKKYLVTIGPFEPRKNLSGILKAFTLLKKKGYPHSLLIIGQREAQDAPPPPLPEDVYLLGYLSEQEKMTVLARASLLLFPSFCEGFGIPIVEAMALGTPVITSKLGAMQEIAKEAAFLIDPSDPDQICEAMESILSSSPVSNTLVDKGLKRAQDFSAAKVLPSLLSLYQSIM